MLTRPKRELVKASLTQVTLDAWVLTPRALLAQKGRGDAAEPHRGVAQEARRCAAVQSAPRAAALTPRVSSAQQRRGEASEPHRGVAQEARHVHGADEPHRSLPQQTALLSAPESCR